MEIPPIAIATIMLLVLLFMKTPVFASLLTGTVAYFLLTPNVPSRIIAQRVMAGAEMIPMLAIPFFICAGIIMNYSGVTERVLRFCDVVSGRMVGGLAQVNTLMSTLMGGLSGSNLADAAMTSKMVIPEMRRQGFSNAFSSVVTAVSALITPLIPPGIAMIVYGSIANISIGKLFISGFGVGLMLCMGMMIVNRAISRKRGYMPNRVHRLSFAEFVDALRAVALPLCLPVLIIGGIRFGVFTPTEAGAVAIIYAIFLGVIYKKLTLQNVVLAVKDTVITTAGIMLIVCAANAFAWVLTRERIPQILTETVVTIITNQYLFLFCVNIFLLICGMFVEGTAIMIVLVPLLAPIANAFGINEIQFGIMFVFNMAIGCVTPPLGTVMFVTCGITRCPIKDFVREAFPYYLMLFICLMLLAYVPAFSLGLVNLIY
jgi:tripartite ATP-independent transporter DctM subunit